MLSIGIASYEVSKWHSPILLTCAFFQVEFVNRVWYSAFSFSLYCFFFNVTEIKMILLMQLDMLRIQDRLCYIFLPADRIYLSLNQGSQNKTNQENRETNVSIFWWQKLNSLWLCVHLTNPCLLPGRLCGLHLRTTLLTVLRVRCVYLSSVATASSILMVPNLVSLDKNLLLVLRLTYPNFLDFSI